VKWDAQGLVPVIAQEQGTGDVLMFAWMNREALAKTAELGRAVYFSRSRDKLWFKGEESGHVQRCTKFASIATTTWCCSRSRSWATSPALPATPGRHSCFFSVLKDGAWQAVDPVLKDPENIYK
jgi:phosphoribosyl-AMP cyclohydrolase